MHELDVAIVAQRIAAWNLKPGVRIGDVVIVDQTQHRVAYDATHVWPHDPDEVVLQFGEFGEWYLANDHQEFSGGLNCVYNMTLRQTSKTRQQECWFFHNDIWSRGNLAYVQVPVRVFVASNVRSVPRSKNLMGPLSKYS